MAAQFTSPQLPEDKELAGKILDSTSSLDRFKAERGLLGAVWGSSSNVPHNIAAFMILGLLAIGGLYTYVKASTPVDDKSLSIKDFWAIIAPLITLSLGYLFGDKKKSETDKS